MISYYSSIIILCWMTLAILGILVHENPQIDSDTKKAFCRTFILIALAALAERLGVMLENLIEMPVWMLRLVKCFDYILTPIAGGSFIAMMPVRRERRVLLRGILGFNIVFQIISLYTNWMIVIDGNHRYSHGSLYWVYILCYLVVIILIVLEFFEYGRSFRRQNRKSLFGIMLLMLTGIAMQELLGSDTHRTVYLAMTVSAALMLMQYTEFTQMKTEDLIHRQYKQITTDSLTGLLNRQAYTKAKIEYDSLGRLPESLVVMMIDINGLKETNDRLGHDAGDELICGAAECIRSSIGSRGECYRVGGDEFVVFSDMTKEEMDRILQILNLKISLWSGENGNELSLAIGHARAGDHPGLGIDKLVFEADQAMYDAKEKYYLEKGHDRRRTHQ